MPFLKYPLKASAIAGALFLKSNPSEYMKYARFPY